MRPPRALAPEIAEPVSRAALVVALAVLPFLLRLTLDGDTAVRVLVVPTTW